MELVTEKNIKTEFGEIPSDWISCRFEDVMIGFTSGQTPHRAVKRYYDGDIPWITSGELNYDIVTDTKEKITEEAVRKTGLKLIPKGTFLMAITGLEAEGTRGSCAITGIEATTNQSCMALYPKKGLLATEYLYHFYLQYGNGLAFRYCQGTKQQSYTGRIARSLPIILPPSIEEQIAIAEALSDNDNLISSLEHLIEKKRRIKLGALQALMRPDQGWSRVKIKELGQTFGGLSGKTKRDFAEGNFPYIPFLNVLNNPVIDCRFLDYVKIKSNEIQNRALKNDLFFNGSSETPDEVGMCSVLLEDVPNLYLNSFCFGFRLSSQNHDGMFLSYFFRSAQGRKIFYSLAQGATRYNLSKTNFLEAEVQLPELQEQQKIAGILKEIDSEIIALENKLQKTRYLKQGMMHNLLTGKVRLKTLYT